MRRDKLLNIGWIEYPPGTEKLVLTTSKKTPIVRVVFPMYTYLQSTNPPRVFSVVDGSKPLSRRNGLTIHPLCAIDSHYSHVSSSGGVCIGDATYPIMTGEMTPEEAFWMTRFKLNHSPQWLANAVEKGYIPGVRVPRVIAQSMHTEIYARGLAHSTKMVLARISTKRKPKPKPKSKPKPKTKGRR